LLVELAVFVDVEVAHFLRASPYFEAFDLPDLLRATACRTSALNADSSTSSPSWMSIARRTFPSRLELKRRAGSFRDAPLAKVNFTMDLYVSPVQMIPSCDHVGVPGLVGFTHFNSSTTSGSAFLMSVRILLRVFPRQSPSSAILFEMSSDGDWPWLASDLFMFSPISDITYLVVPLTPAGGRERVGGCGCPAST